MAHVAGARGDCALADVQSTPPTARAGRRDQLHLLQRDALPPLAAIAEGVVGGGEAGPPSVGIVEFTARPSSHSQQQTRRRAARRDIGQAEIYRRQRVMTALARSPSPSRTTRFRSTRGTNATRAASPPSPDPAGKQRDQRPPPPTSAWRSRRRGLSGAQARAAATGAARPLVPPRRRRAARFLRLYVLFVLAVLRVQGRHRPAGRGAARRRLRRARQAARPRAAVPRVVGRARR